MTDRDLVRLYWPAELRPAFDALFGIDDALADVVTSSTQPALGAIRLAWWREALERIDTNPAPPEPRLQAVVFELLPRGVTGATLAELEDGWAALLDDEPDADRVSARGARLFAIGAQLIGTNDPLLGTAGRLFANAQSWRRGMCATSVPAEELRQLSGHRFARRLRPISAMARLAAREARQLPAIEAEATPGRAAALLSHRLFGTVA